jgi:hypothetical protein
MTIVALLSVTRSVGDGAAVTHQLVRVHRN